MRGGGLRLSPLRHLALTALLAPSPLPVIASLVVAGGLRGSRRAPHCRLVSCSTLMVPRGGSGGGGGPRSASPSSNSAGRGGESGYHKKGGDSSLHPTLTAPLP